MDKQLKVQCQLHFAHRMYVSILGLMDKQLKENRYFHKKVIRVGFNPWFDG
jgi:hypothetical protein